jgi:hypothetical protein
MVLQVLADPGKVVDDADAVAVEQRLRADAGELQQLRRLQRAGRQQHLGAAACGLRLAALAKAHADRTPAVEQQPGRLRLGLDAQVAAPARRAEVGLRGAAAPALPGVELEVAGAFLARAVEVVGARHADLAGAADERLDQLVLGTDVRDLQRTVAAVERARAALVAFGLDEVRQHVVVTPALVADGGPVVEVLALAADVDQAR